MTAVGTEAITPTVRQVARRWRFWAVAAGVVVLLVAANQLLNAAGGIGTEFGPDNAAPDGARALRVVLEEQGVRVTTVTRVARARSTGGALLVDDGDELLSAAAWRRLADGTPRLIVVSPGSTALRALLPGVRAAGQPEPGEVRAGCASAAAGRAGSMALAGVTRSLRSDGATLCFRDARGAGQLVTARRGGTRVVLLADRKAFTNERITGAGNASVALNVLGATDGLTWYDPSPLDLGIKPRATLQDLTPPWVTPVAALLLLAGLAAAFWRGRRLGPVVLEALPVAVRSRETVEGRARLYGRGRARLRAADGLRIGAVGRIAPLVGLGRAASVEEVAGAAARLTGRQPTEVLGLLLTAEPATDRELIRVSDDLARLEAAVRAAAVPGATTDPTRGT